MTQWAIGHTDRFKAAVSGGGVFDEASEFGTEDDSAGDEWYFGTPWEHPEIYARNSPSTFIGNARTPILITITRWPDNRIARTRGALDSHHPPVPPDALPARSTRRSTPTLKTPL